MLISQLNQRHRRRISVEKQSFEDVVRPRKGSYKLVGCCTSPNFIGGYSQ